jgi:redox-sensitive bicupin YhaK (pirin superfamily)
VHFDEDGLFEATLPETHHAFIYVYRGCVQVLGERRSTAVPNERMGVLGAGEILRLQAQAGSRAIVLAGQPLREPIAQHGPFVMNTRQQLIEAVDDFRAGRMG